mgnify:FL=1
MAKRLVPTFLASAIVLAAPCAAQTLDAAPAPLAGAPQDADALRREAAALAAAGQYDAALALIDAARALAPQDNDIALARARILLWSGKLGAARAEAATVHARAPDYPELAAVEAAIAAALQAQRRRAGIALSAGLADIALASGSDARWQSAAVSGFAPFGDRLTATATIDYEKRAVSDTRLALSLSRAYPLGELRLGIAATPNADFRERWSVQAGTDIRLDRHVTLSADARFADYADVSVTALNPAVRLQTGDARHALTARLIAIFRSDGESDTGASLRYDGQVSGRIRLYGGGASYPDTEAGVTRQLRSGFLGGAIDIGPATSLSLTAEYDRRERSYTRKALMLALVHRLGG